MKVTKPTKPDGSNYPPHSCPWGLRNPKNHLTTAKFKALLMEMLRSDDHQHIQCPGCKRVMYLNLSIPVHNKPGMHKPPRPDQQEDHDY